MRHDRVRENVLFSEQRLVVCDASCCCRRYLPKQVCRTTVLTAITRCIDRVTDFRVIGWNSSSRTTRSFCSKLAFEGPHCLAYTRVAWWFPSALGNDGKGMICLEVDWHNTSNARERQRVCHWAVLEERTVFPERSLPSFNSTIAFDFLLGVCSFNNSLFRHRL